MSAKVSLAGRHAVFQRLAACDHLLHVSRTYPYSAGGDGAGGASHHVLAALDRVAAFAPRWAIAAQTCRFRIDNVRCGCVWRGSM